MDTTNCQELLQAAHISISRLQEVGGLTSAQADLIVSVLAAAAASVATAVPPPSGDSTDDANYQRRWENLPDEIMEAVVAAAQRPNLLNFTTQPWWIARLVCRSWCRVFSENFRSWDMSLGCPDCPTFRPYPSRALLRPGEGPSGEEQEQSLMLADCGYRFTARGLYGSYTRWLAQRFPNLRHLSLPDLDGPEEPGSSPCRCAACRFISLGARDSMGMTAVLESLGAFKRLTCLDWHTCPGLCDDHLEAIAEALPQLDCLLLNHQTGDHLTYSLRHVTDAGLRSMSRLTALRRLHVQSWQEARHLELSTAGVAALTTLRQLTSLTCGRVAVNASDLSSIASMTQLQELDLRAKTDECGVGMGHPEGDTAFAITMVPDDRLMELSSLQGLSILRLPDLMGWSEKGGRQLLAVLPKLVSFND